MSCATNIIDACYHWLGMHPDASKLRQGGERKRQRWFGRMMAVAFHHRRRYLSMKGLTNLSHLKTEVNGPRMMWIQAFI